MLDLYPNLSYKNDFPKFLVFFSRIGFRPKAFSSLFILLLPLISELLSPLLRERLIALYSAHHSESKKLAFSQAA